MKKLHIVVIICLIFLFCSTIFAQNYKQIKIYLDSRNDIQKLIELGLEFDHILYEKDNSITVFLSDEEYSILKNSGYCYEIIIDDWFEHYSNQNKMTNEEKRIALNNTFTKFNVSGFDFGSMGGYYTLNEVYERLDTMYSKFPNLITKRDTIGSSIEGRKIYYVKISDNPNNDEDEPEILFTALTHAREPEGMMQMIYFMFYLLDNYGVDPVVTYLIDNREIYFIPVLNVDGYFWNQTTNPGGGGMWRKNRRNNGTSYGVDLNRNFGPYEYWNSPFGGSSTTPSSDTYRGTAPFSEPELQALRNFLYQRDIRVCLNYHTYGNYLIHPWGAGMGLTPDSNLYREWADEMTQFNNFSYGTELETVGYGTRGNSDDYLYSGDTNNIGKIFAMTPEVGKSSDGFWPLQSRIIPLAEECLFPNLYYTWVAGECVSITSYYFEKFAELGDTNSLSITLKNKGLSHAYNVSVDISSLNPSVILLNNIIEVDTLFAQTVFTPNELFYMFVDPTASVGDYCNIELKSYIGSTQVSCDTISFLIGKPNIIFSDNCDSLSHFWNITSNTFKEWDSTKHTYYSNFSSYTESKNNNYNSNSEINLILKENINLTNISNPILSFRTKYSIEKNWDCGKIFVSTNDGISWTELEGKFTSKATGSGVQVPVGSPIYHGTKNLWLLETISLSSFTNKNIKLKFSFLSDNSVVRNGWFIDDIIIFTLDTIQTSIEENKIFTFKLEQNYPNPFNPTTTIRYSIPSNVKWQMSNVILKIYNVLGQEIATLVNEEKKPGDYEVIFNASNLPSGVYFYRLKAGEFTSSKKMIILK